MFCDWVHIREEPGRQVASGSCHNAGAIAAPLSDDAVMFMSNDTSKTPIILQRNFKKTCSTKVKLCDPLRKVGRKFGLSHCQVRVRTRSPYSTRWPRPRPGGKGAAKSRRTDREAKTVAPGQCRSSLIDGVSAAARGHPTGQSRARSRSR